MSDLVACPECSQVGLAPNVCEVCGHRWYAVRSDAAAPLDVERLAHGFAIKYGLREGMDYDPAMRLEQALATYLRAALEPKR